jgi:AcrR family transcriptional regulator
MRLSATSSGQRRKAPRREREVVRAAATVFCQRGYAAATVREVADELGINISSLYHYIEGKEDLLVSIFAEVHDDVERILDEVVSAEGLTALERLVRYVDRVLAYSFENAQRLTVYHEEMDHLRGQRREEVRARRREHDYVVTRLIRDAQEEGAIASDLDAHMLGNCLFVIVASSYRWFPRSTRIPRERMIDCAAEFVLRGMIGRLPAEFRYRA